MYNYIEKFEAILDEFDFNKVKEVMDCLDWTWHDIGIPNIKSMKSACWELFESSLSEYLNTRFQSPIFQASTSSGGFKVTISKEYVLLEFIVAERDTEFL